LPGRELPAYLHLSGHLGPGASIELPEADAHYVARVCRATRGDLATATDGNGAVARIEVVDVGTRVVVRCVSIEHVIRASEAWILCGAPEEGRADWLVEKLAELGIARFVPVDGKRGSWRSGRTDRWRRVASAALRQSCQAHALEIVDPLPFDQALADVPADASRWSARAEGECIELPRPAPARIAGVIGPAGGWSEPELERLSELGFRDLRLAGSRLRSETAALAWAAWWARGS
jgi:16S rRNA (uracil1498-N3)-methyltransferase